MTTDSATGRAAGGLDTRLEERARAVAEAVGDVAVATRAAEDEGVLVTVAAHHRNPERQAAARAVLGERYRRGEGLPGRVWEAERGILIVDVDDPALAAISPPNSSAYVRDLGIRSLMLVPLWEGGRVVGTLGAARDRDGSPYSEEEFVRLQQLAVLG